MYKELIHACPFLLSRNRSFVIQIEATVTRFTIQRTSDLHFQPRAYMWSAITDSRNSPFFKLHFRSRALPLNPPQRLPQRQHRLLRLNFRSHKLHPTKRRTYLNAFLLHLHICCFDYYGAIAQSCPICPLRSRESCGAFKDVGNNTNWISTRNHSQLVIHCPKATSDGRSNIEDFNPSDQRDTLWGVAGGEKPSN